MKKLFLFILLSVPFALFGQGLNIRHVKGIKSLEVDGGISRYGNLYSIGYVKYLSKTLYWDGKLIYEGGKGNGISYSSMGAQFYFAKTLTSYGYKYYLNAIGGAHVSVDNANNGLENIKINSAFKTGVLMGIENEIFISDRFVFLITYQQDALLGTDFGNYRWFATGGIRWNF